MYDESYYIKEISKRCTDRYGNLLIKLMEENNVNALKDLTLEQFVNFYNRVKDLPVIEEKYKLRY